MRKYILVSFLMPILWVRGQQKHVKKQSPDRPNIIFFLVDDMGWEDCSVPFWDSITAQNKKFQTPNMVHFAATAEKFTNAYANSICTPSRVSLMSGMDAGRHRVTNWTMFKNKAVDAKDSQMQAPEWNVNGLSPVPGDPRSVYVTPLPQILKDNGYYTIQCGKAHFGAYQTPGANPLNLGFMKNIGGSAAGNPASYLAEDDFGYDPAHFNVRADIPNMQQYWHTPSFLTEDLTIEAQKAMDTARSLHKPFFLYMAQYAVHLPYNPDKRFVQKYLDKGFTIPEAAYCALIEGMDKSFGDLLTYLMKNDLEKNTIVIFMSDNGGFSHAPRQGKENSQNYPLRNGKGSLYEGGIREPMMVRWPGVTREGSSCDQYVIIQDFFPTILEMAGIRKPAVVQHIDGQSMVPYLSKPSFRDNSRTLTWNFPNGWSGGHLSQDCSWTCAVRQGDWKLIYFEKYGRLELYNLKEDIKEVHDLSMENRQKTKELARLLTKKLKQQHAQMTVLKSTGQWVPYPDQVKL